MDLKSALAKVIKGDVEATAEARAFYSHDASMFEIPPEVVVFPKDSQDICNLVRYVADHKSENPALSLTGRSGGTDMGGGAINDSIVVAFDRYFNNIGAIENDHVSVQPGVFYRNFEPKTLEAGKLMPSYPVSRELCMIGGMVANNAGGEKSLIYGKTDRYVQEVKIVLRDGREHTFRAVDKAGLDKKLAEDGIEGDIYRGIYQLVTTHTAQLKESKPKVTKNSTGYNLWDVWDGQTFDITKVIVGSQGTLGMITEVTFRLVPAKPLSGMVVVFMPSFKNLGQIINTLLPLEPSSLESFDKHTLGFAFRFFLAFRKTLGWKKFIFLGLSFIPVLGKLIRYLPHFPEIIMLVEFEGESQDEIDAKVRQVEEGLKPYDVDTKRAKNKHQEEKFWVMRRESFNLLRKNVKRKHTAPFIDDLIVPASTLPQFLPELTEILERYKLLYTVAGHMGDGNFHIIPLMDLSDQNERQKIPKVLEEVTELVLKYEGSLSGEHNDGLIRGPFLKRMYKPEVIALFETVKKLFDPENIFNPHKKTTADWQYSEAHMRKKF